MLRRMCGEAEGSACFGSGKGLSHAGKPFIDSFRHDRGKVYFQQGIGPAGAAHMDGDVCGLGPPQTGETAHAARIAGFER